jgi:hypothetical protein
MTVKGVLFILQFKGMVLGQLSSGEDLRIAGVP